MKYEAEKPAKEAERYTLRRDAFWSQTVSENNARLTSKGIPASVLSELKFIESILLSERREN